MILTVYHGTDCIFESIELGKSADFRDFGSGFYTTTISSQAENWARSKKLRNNSLYAYVYVYEAALTDELRIKRYHGLTVEWLEMIRRNRKMGGIRHEYDIVMGPVANDNTLLTVNRYMQGIYTEEEAIRRLEYARANDQLSFHTEKSLTCLRLIRRYSVE